MKPLRASPEPPLHLPVRWVKFAEAFEEWDRRYRENPDEFLSTVHHLLGETPTTYGEAAAAYFGKLLEGTWR